MNNNQANTEIKNINTEQREEASSVSSSVSSSDLIKRIFSIVELLETQKRFNNGEECTCEHKKVAYECDCCSTVSPNDGCCNIMCEEFSEMTLMQCHECSLWYQGQIGDSD